METKQREFFKCNQCGWIHFAIERDEGNASSKCFSCGNDLNDFVQVSASECPVGATIQAIYYPEK